MKSHFVEDLLKLKLGDSFSSPFRLSGLERREKNDGALYLTLQLGDRTGSLEAKWWNCTEDHCTRALQFRYACIEGKMRQFGGRKEVHMHSEPSWLEEPEDASPYELVAPLPLTTLRRRLDSHIRSLRTPHLKVLLTRLFSSGRFLTRFEAAPAAQYYHHAFRHGLLQHTVEVADLAIGMAEAQSGWGYRSVSRDLVLAGALLHDIGKVDELIQTDSGEFAASRRGQMLGHIVIGIQRLSKEMNKIEGFPPALTDALLHIVVSHHGKKEFGSPIIPLFPEAQIIHMADQLDTQLFYMQEAAAGATAEFVKVPKLDKQLLYTQSWDNVVDTTFANTVTANTVTANAHHANDSEAGVESISKLAENSPNGIDADIDAYNIDDAPKDNQALALSPLASGNSLPVFRFCTPGSTPSFVTRRVPLVGQAAAGQPITAEEYIEDVYEIEAENLPVDRELFLLRVSGDSMSGDGIADRDIVIVRKQDNYDHNAILVVYLADRDEVTLKRVEQSGSGAVHLLSSNPTYLPISVVDPSALRVRGQVLGLLRKTLH